MYVKSGLGQLGVAQGHWN